MILYGQKNKMFLYSNMNVIGYDYITNNLDTISSNLLITVKGIYRYNNRAKKKGEISNNGARSNPH